MNPDQLTRQIKFLLAAILLAGRAPTSTDGGINVSGSHPGNVTPGNHQLGYTFVYPAGESGIELNANLSAGSNFNFTLGTAAIAPPPQVMAIKIYAGLAGGLSSGPLYLLGSTPPGGSVAFNASDATLATLPLFGGDPAPVFTDVILFPPDARDHGLDLAPVPFVTIEPAKALETHREHPELVERCSWQIDVYGVGADDNSTPPAPQLLYVEDLEPLVRAALAEAGLGLSVIPGESDELFAEPTYTTAAGRVTSRTLVVTAHRVPAQETFEPVDRVKASGASGTVSLSWAHPGSRFDAVGTVVRRGTNSGDAAPTSPAAGTAVAVDGRSTSAVDLPGTGTWHYAFFESYDRTGNGGAANRWSAPLTAQATA